ncbi:MAG TPA: hypothetical protein VGU01_15190 [Sphingomicrobium sp.]|nr:hypothetical protein [Sphingomicrobium sp.]
MTKNQITASVLAICLSLEACSSRPRQFAPQVAIAPAAQAQFEAAYRECRELLANGKLDANGRSASVAAGAGAGAGTAAVGGAAAAAAGGWGGVALASATIVLLPFAVVGGAWGMSRMKRTRKERAIKAALQGCLRERGYDVEGWIKTPKKPLPSHAS